MNAERFAGAFAGLGEDVVEEFDSIEVLYAPVERCVELPDATAASLMLDDGRGQLVEIASSTEERRVLELFELQKDQGPALECSRSGHPVAEEDLSAARERWPRFAPAATEAGFRSVDALPMHLRARTVGALSLFRAGAGSLTDSDVRIAHALLEVAALGLILAEAGRRRKVVIAQLQHALDSRVVIEQAKGVLAERLRTTPAAAFEVLRAHARSHGLRLSDLARQVVQGHAKPRPARPRARAMSA